MPFGRPIHTIALSFAWEHSNIRHFCGSPHRIHHGALCSILRFSNGESLTSIFHFFKGEIKSISLLTDTQLFSLSSLIQLVWGIGGSVLDRLEPFFYFKIFKCNRAKDERPAAAGIHKAAFFISIRILKNYPIYVHFPGERGRENEHHRDIRENAKRCSLEDALDSKRRCLLHKRRMIDRWYIFYELYSCSPAA